MKKLKDFYQKILESPSIDYETKDEFIRTNDIHRKHILKFYHRSKSIGGGSFVCATNDYWYFHKDDAGNPLEINCITTQNKQIYVDKSSGDVKFILNHMKYHIKHHGELFSDNEQSYGGRDLWIKFIKSTPVGIKFEYIVGDAIHKVDKKSIDSLTPVIWGKNSKLHREIVIRAYKA